MALCAPGPPDGGGGGGPPPGGGGGSPAAGGGGGGPPPPPEPTAGGTAEVPSPPSLPLSAAKSGRGATTRTPSGCWSWASSTPPSTSPKSIRLSALRRSPPTHAVDRFFARSSFRTEELSASATTITFCPRVKQCDGKGERVTQSDGKGGRGKVTKTNAETKKGKFEVENLCGQPNVGPPSCRGRWRGRRAAPRRTVSGRSSS